MRILKLYTKNVLFSKKSIIICLNIIKIKKFN